MILVAPVIPLILVARVALEPRNRAATFQLAVRSAILFGGLLIARHSAIAVLLLAPLWALALWSYPVALLALRYGRRPSHVYYATFAAAPFELRHSYRGGAALMTTLWLLRREERSDEEIAWVRAKLARLHTVEAAGMTAYALLCAAQGDLATARTLTEAIVVETREGSASARRTARRFLVLDAVRDGRWTDAFGYGRDGDALCRAILRRLVGRPPTRAERRSEAFALRVWPGLAKIPQGHLGAPFEPERRSLPSDATERAVFCNGALALARSLEAKSVHFVNACQAWEIAFAGSELPTSALARARSLGVDPADPGDWRQLIVQELANEVRANRFDLGPDNAVSSAVRRAVAEELLAEIEIWARRLEARLPYMGRASVHEWIEYRSMRRMYDDAWRTGGHDARVIAYLRVYPSVTELVVRASNYGFDLPLARAATLWMRMEAWQIGHAESFQLHTGNVAATDR